MMVLPPGPEEYKIFNLLTDKHIFYYYINGPYISKIGPKVGEKPYSGNFPQKKVLPKGRTKLN